MSEPEDTAGCGAPLDTQLRLFCHLMLGSADAADRMMRQIYCHAAEYRGGQQDRQSERIRLFGIAATLCGVRDGSSHR
ncbi:Uncharacterised protein [Nocardia africana]|uniref:Uncharacterized protein n=1 Tax=Nocardia africana TaxID=134964 RepID=A0A378WS23_9NOCA|nr:Uncharacterised protein [Nocardia africana]